MDTRDICIAFFSCVCAFIFFYDEYVITSCIPNGGVMNAHDLGGTCCSVLLKMSIRSGLILLFSPGIHHQYIASVPVDKGNGSKEYKCPLCPYKTTRRGNVRLHLITHSDRHPFLCPTCSKAFKRSNDLRRHLLRVHTRT